MNCKICGFANSSKDSTCRNCGAPLEKNTYDNIFGEDILKPIEVTNLNDNNEIEDKIDNKEVETIEVHNDINDVLASKMPSQAEIQTPVIIPANVEEAVPTLMTDENNIVQESETSLNNLDTNQKSLKSEPFDLKKTLIIVSGIVLAALIILVAVIIATKGRESKYQGVSPIVVDQNYKISFSGYDMSISKNLMYEIADESLIIRDKNEKWITIIQVSDFNYSKLVVNKEQIKTSYEKLGMKVSSMTEKTYNDVTYLTSEMVKSNTEMVLGITKASTDQSFVVISIKPDYKLSYDGLSNIASILKNAIYTGDNKTSNIKSNFFDFSQIKG